MSVVLRLVRTADLDAVMAIETRLFATDAWSRSMMAAEFRSRHTHYLVATTDDDETAVLGYAGLQMLRGAAEADVQTIAVVESARGTGLGRRLLDALLAEARDRGAREVFLEVRADNPVAQSLYRSTGFAELGVRPGYYQPDGVDAVVMRLALAAEAAPADPASPTPATGEPS